METTTLKDYKKALETIKNFKSQCSKCGTKVGDRWEFNANSFVLHLKFDCQSTEALFGEKANEIGFNHPAIQEKSDYQEVTIKSGKELPYRLCPSCNRKFARLIGDFIQNNQQNG